MWGVSTGSHSGHVRDAATDLVDPRSTIRGEGGAPLGFGGFIMREGGGALFGGF